MPHSTAANDITQKRSRLYEKSVIVAALSDNGLRTGERRGNRSSRPFCSVAQLSVTNGVAKGLRFTANHIEKANDWYSDAHLCPEEQVVFATAP